MSYFNAVTLVGFVGADPEQRQARSNGSKFTVLSVATQRSWKNTEDEWVSRPSGIASRSSVRASPNTSLTAIKKGAHILVEGELVSSTYDRPNAKGKKRHGQKSGLRGPSAPMSSASSIGRKLSRKQPARSPAKLRLPTRRRSEN